MTTENNEDGGRVIEARNGDGEIVASFTPDEMADREAPVTPSIDGPSRARTERHATAELLADTINAIHQRLAHVERLQGIEHDTRDQATVIIATDRGDIA